MSIIRAALTDADGTVANVIVLDTASKWTPPQGLTVRQLADTDLVGPGWAYDAAGFHAPPSLTVDGATVTYTDTRKAAPSPVEFTVDGTPREVPLSSGTATVTVTPGASPVEVAAGGLTVTVEAAPA